MSQKALDIMLKRKKLLNKGFSNVSKLNRMLEQAEKAGGLTSEERYVLMFSMGE